MAVKIRRKTFRQKLKEPDEFISFSARSLTFLKENLKRVIGTSLVVILIILSIGFFIQRSGAKREEFASKIYNDIFIANKSYSDGLYDVAEKSFEDIIKRTDKASVFNEIALVGLGYTYMDTGKLDKSLEVFEGLISKNDLQYPKEELYKNLAVINEKTGKIKKAIEIYNKIIALHPESFDLKHYKQEIARLGNE